MLRSGFTVDEKSAPALTPDSLKKLKKEDMKQAMVERFTDRSNAVSRGTVTAGRKRSPCWQPVDEEC